MEKPKAKRLELVKQLTKIMWDGDWTFEEMVDALKTVEVAMLGSLETTSSVPKRRKLERLLGIVRKKV